MTLNAMLILVGLAVIASPVVYVVGRLEVRLHRTPQDARWLTYVIVMVLWVMLPLLVNDSTPHLLTGTIDFKADALTVLVTAAALTLTSAALVFSSVTQRHTEGEEKYYAALLMMIGALIGMVTSADLFNLWVWFELMTVASYLLVMFQRGDALEAGVKYLFQSAAGSVLILLGIALVLMQTGSVSLTAIAESAAIASPFIVLAGALFLIGFGVKVALVPLHTWLPDAHAQAPSAISALLSGVVIEAALIVLLRVIAALSGATQAWGTLLLIFAALNLLAGNLLALRQTNIKRMLAYSSVSHVGVILLGLGIAITTGSAAAASGGFFHLLTHALMKGLAFLAAGALIYALNVHNLTRDSLAGAAQRYPLTALMFSVALVSLAGLPPLAGFMSKWQIFVAGFETRNGVVMLLVIFAAFNSLISLAYYMPVINALYRQKAAPDVCNGRALPLAIRLPLVALAALVIFFGLLPDAARVFTDPAAAMLIGGF